MDAIDLLKGRRSIRSFQDKEIEESLLNEVMELAVFAPTAMNSQSSQIVVIRDKETQDKLRKMNAEVMGKDIDPYYGAPIIVVVLGPTDYNTSVENGTSVLVYMELAAYTKGLASVWVHREREMFSSEEGKNLLKEWNIPEGYGGIGALAIGYAAGDYPEPAPRREGYAITI